jgi:hypothetical protein
MKRSEVLIKLQRYYGIKHVMVEERYITPDEFMDNVLTLVEELGMLPPYHEKEEEINSRIKSTTPELSNFYKWEPE